MRITTILYRLAVSLWIGGSALFTFLLTPAIFKSYSRDLAGGIVGVLFPGYFRWGLACGAAALVCLAVFRERSSVTPAIIIAAMLIITAVQAFVIEPRAAELKKSIHSFEITSDDPQRAEFRKLHGISAAANLAVIGGGIALVVLF
jgi:uncharacterized membrane protein